MSAAALFLCRLFRAKEVTVAVRRATTLGTTIMHTALVLNTVNRMLVTTPNLEAC